MLPMMNFKPEDIHPNDFLGMLQNQLNERLKQQEMATKLQYMPEQLKAQIALHQMQTKEGQARLPLIGAQTSEAYAHIPYLKAQAAKENEEAAQQHMMNIILKGGSLPGMGGNQQPPPQQINPPQQPILQQQSDHKSFLENLIRQQPQQGQGMFAPTEQQSQQGQMQSEGQGMFAPNMQQPQQMQQQNIPQPSPALVSQGKPDDFRNFAARHMLMKKTGIDFVGPAATVESLQGIKALYGVDSPQAKMAQNLFDAQMQQKGLSGLSQLEKYQRGMDKAIENGDPDKANQFALGIQKITTDTQIRRQNLYATNVEKTLDTIDPKVLAYYSGIDGKTKLANDYKLSLQGKAPEMFKEYQSIVHTKIPLLSSQVRQFYQDSIQPSVKQHLESLSNTSTWQDPAIATKRFNDFKQILNSELKTYRDAIKSTDVYQGKGLSQSQNIQQKIKRYNPETGRIE